MKKVELIDVNDYFVESKKALQVILEREKFLEKQMKTTDKLDLVKSHKKNTNSPEEYEVLEALEKELERKLRFNRLNEPAVPEEHKEKVRRNAAVELQEVEKLLAKLKAQLRFHYKYVEDQIIPLITNIEKLECLKAIPVQINIIKDVEIGEGAVFKAGYLTRQVSHSAYEKIAKDININLNKVIKDMKRLEFAADFSQVKEGEK